MADRKIMMKFDCAAYVDGALACSATLTVWSSPRDSPTAIIDDAAVLGDNVEIGPMTSGRVVRGWRPRSLTLCSRAVGLATGYRFISLPPLAKTRNCLRGELGAEIGQGTIIREGVTITAEWPRAVSVKPSLAQLSTVAYVHIGHDCIVGDNVIMANNASLAGHVEVGTLQILAVIRAFLSFVRSAPVRISRHEPGY